MKSSKDDIRQFDQLESESFDPIMDQMLSGIQQVDELLSNSPDRKLSDQFTASVMESAMRIEHKPSRFWFFTYLIGGAVSMISLGWLAMTLEPNSASPQYLPQVMNVFEHTITFLTDPKMKQLLIICEAILVLLVADRVFAKVRNISTSAH